MKCKVCNTEVMESTDPEVTTNRLVNHIFTAHTLPGIEEMLKEHAEHI